MNAEHDTWAGPITAWASLATLKLWPEVAQAADWMVSTGLPLVLGCSTVWWTIAKARRETEARLREREQAKRERAQRLAIEGLMHDDRRSMWARILGRPMETGPVPLDSTTTTDPQAHHLGKDGPP